MMIRHYRSKFRKRIQLTRSMTKTELEEVIRLVKFLDTTYVEKTSASEGTIIGRRGSSTLHHFVLRAGEHGDPRIKDGVPYEVIEISDYLWEETIIRSPGHKTAEYRAAVEAFCEKLMQHLPT